MLIYSCQFLTYGRHPRLYAGHILASMYGKHVTNRRKIFSHMKNTSIL